MSVLTGRDSYNSRYSQAWYAVYVTLSCLVAGAASYAVFGVGLMYLSGYVDAPFVFMFSITVAIAIVAVFMGDVHHGYRFHEKRWVLDVSLMCSLVISTVTGYITFEHTSMPAVFLELVPTGTNLPFLLTAVCIVCITVTVCVALSFRRELGQDFESF